MKRNEDGINLIRCFALLMVFGFHYYLYNGYHSQPQQGGWMLFANVQRGFFLSCNGLFMMLTGYLKSDKPVNKHYFKCILSAIATYVIAASISIPVRHFFLNQNKSFSEWKDLFLDFGGIYYGWYLKMYIGLILISPIMNACVKNTDSKLLYIMTGLIVVSTSFSEATKLNIYPSYWESAYPLSYYMIGAVIKKTRPDIKKKYLFAIIILGVLGTGMATWLSTDKSLDCALQWKFGTVWIVIITTAIFLLLYRVQLPKKISMLSAFIAGGTFPAYMLSNLTDACIYELVPQWKAPSYYFIGFLLLTIPSYFVWVTVGKIINFVVNKIILKENKKK